MHIRKLVKAGQSSHTISLPKGWIEKRGLKKGDVIYIEELCEDLVIRSRKGEDKSPMQKEVTITVDGKDIGTIQREVTSAYINNCSSINLVGRTINEKTKDIRDVLQNFIALEITEQTSNRIAAKDLLNPKEISIDKTIRRMDMIIRSIISDLRQAIDGKEVYDSIHFRDSDVNRLYFLLYRLLKRNLAGQAPPDDVKRQDYLSLWYLTVNLEDIADYGKSISDIAPKIDRKRDLRPIGEIYSMIGEIYLEAMKSYFNSDKKLAESVAQKRIGVFDKCRLFLDKSQSSLNAELAGNFKEISTRITNIARIVLDRE